jgi:hypothetical protein
VRDFDPVAAERESSRATTGSVCPIQCVVAGAAIGALQIHSLPLLAQAGEKVKMQNVTQPFVNLANANSALISRFVQSPEMVELAKSSAEKYFELAQKSFGHAAAAGAYTDLVHRLTENYSTFAQEYSQSLMGIAAEGQSLIKEQVKATSDGSARTGKAPAAASAKAPGKAKSSRRSR